MTSTLVRRSLTLAFLILGACGDNDGNAPPADGGVDTPSGCIKAVDCDDGDACTTDTCSASRQCEHEPKAIDDSIACTVDACNTATGEVTHTPTQAMCNDSASCSADACDPTAAGADPVTGCTHTLNDAACTDTFSCTTNACSPGANGADATTGCVATPDNAACGDSIGCTNDACDPSAAGAGADGCVHQTDNAMCEVDGKSCTVATCSATTGCSETPMDSLCNDNASCSTDTCSATGPGATGCVYTLDDAVCADSAECSTDTCAPGTGADATTGCTHAADASACDTNATCSGTFDCTCNSGFTGDGLTCSAASGACDPLSNPANGTVMVSNSGMFPSTATYACNTGFAALTSLTRTCNMDGSWTGAEPACLPTFFVVRVGDGVDALAASSTAVFLEERDAAGTVLRTIALPTTANGAQAAFTLQGTASAEGGLSRSTDGRYVVLAGYAATTGIANINGTVNRSTDATPTNRVIARVAADGTVDTSTLLLNAFSAASVRAASTVDGSGFWASGTSSGSPNTGGVHYAPFGNTAATTIVSTTQNNLRHTHVFGSQLYTSSGAGTMTRGVMAVGTGLPTTSGEASTSVVMLSGNLAANSFAVLDLDPVVIGMDTVYVAFDSGGTAGTVNLQKWTFNGTTWTQATFAPTVTGTVVPLTIGLATWLDGTTVHIILTTNENPGRILEVIDDGVNTTPAANVLDTAAANTAFRGTARSPTQ